MNSFEFDDRQVEICGKVYTIDFDQPKMNEYAEKVQTELHKMKDDNAKLTKRTIDAFRKLIDLLLGEGAFDEIFTNQEITMTALSKLLIFLTGEIVEEARVYKRFDTSDIEDFIKQASDNT